MSKLKQVGGNWDEVGSARARTDGLDGRWNYGGGSRRAGNISLLLTLTEISILGCTHFYESDKNPQISPDSISSL